MTAPKGNKFGELTAKPGTAKRHQVRFSVQPDRYADQLHELLQLVKPENRGEALISLVRETLQERAANPQLGDGLLIPCDCAQCGEPLSIAEVAEWNVNKYGIVCDMCAIPFHEEETMYEVHFDGDSETADTLTKAIDLANYYGVGTEVVDADGNEVYVCTTPDVAYESVKSDEAK